MASRSTAESELIEQGTDYQKNQEHLVGSLDLLVFCTLLIFVILTVWLFKHKNFQYIHYTGLAIIYGLVFGTVILFGVKSPSHTTIQLTAKNLSLDNMGDLPDSIEMSVPNRTEKFVYSFKSYKRSKDVDLISEKASFDPEIFFNLLLPPIIFHAGYSMKRKFFFKNFGAILTFAMLGTAISCFITGAFTYFATLLFSSIGEYVSISDCLFFGAIISATDPVTVLAIFNDQKINVNLYAIVFGESVLNDAVSITLAHSIEKFAGPGGAQTFDLQQFGKFLYQFFSVFFGAFAIGALMGCVTALLTKFTYIRQHPHLETALFMLMSYTTYLAAETAGMTGIIAVLFCGIFQAHYTYNNLSDESKSLTKDMFEMLNFLSENFIFIYIGVTLITFGNHRWEFPFIFTAIVAIVVARAVNVYSLAFLINLARSKRNKIELNAQHLMVFSGLRGAMAFALAIRNTSTRARQLILTTTSVIVIITVILCGGMTKQMMVWLNIITSPVQEEQEENGVDSNERRTGELSMSPSAMQVRDYQSDDAPPSRLKQLLGRIRLFKAWHSFDNTIMKPLLTNSVPPLTETMPNFCMPLALLLTSREQKIKNAKPTHYLQMDRPEGNVLPRSRSPSSSAGSFVNQPYASELEM